MKVIFRKSILDRIVDDAAKAAMDDREIEKIELDLGECKRLRRELEPVWRGALPPSSLADPGRLITKGDHVHVCGIRIEAAESEPHDGGCIPYDNWKR